MDAEVLPQVPAWTRRLNLDQLPDGPPFLVGDDGIARNDYLLAARAFFTDAGGRTSRLPRHWLTEGVSPVIEASRNGASLEECCRRLIEAAKDAGGPDNVTVILVRKAA